MVTNLKTIEPLYRELCNIKKEVGECACSDELVDAKRGCCFWIPCIGGSSSSSYRSSNTIWWERIRSAEKEDKWWTKGWKKVREWSEMLAGPKWKTFIRRFNRDHHHHQHKNNNGCDGGGVKLLKFQYDPSSYALNFDKGIGLNANSVVDDDLGYESLKGTLSCPLLLSPPWILPKMDQIFRSPNTHTGMISNNVFHIIVLERPTNNSSAGGGVDIDD